MHKMLTHKVKSLHYCTYKLQNPITKEAGLINLSFNYICNIWVTIIKGFGQLGNIVVAHSA